MKRRILALKRLVEKNKEAVIAWSIAFASFLVGGIVGYFIIPNIPKIVAIIMGAIFGFIALYMLCYIIEVVVQIILTIIGAYKD